MKLFADNDLVRKLLEATAPFSLNDVLRQAGLQMADKKIAIQLKWPSLIEYLDQGAVFQNFPNFIEHSQLFKLGISALAIDAPKDLLIEMYDQIFVECLTEVKALPFLDQSFLLQHLQQQRKEHPYAEELLASSLDEYERKLKEQAYQTLHDFTLYLAWDRVCIHLAILFEHVSKNPRILNGLDVLKECLLESFQHITQQGKSAPSFFRLIEALYAYQMRQENLHAHSDEEWQVLCEGAHILKPREELADVSYIDLAIQDENDVRGFDHSPITVLSMQPKENIQKTLTLAQLTIDKLKKEKKDWHYLVSPINILCLKEKEGQVHLDTVIHRI
ncbi:MAG: hypothetical protein ACSNEK_09085 [Parachlamydiaceae bacterium]